ncbi:hypothetical protein QBC38DRAFT_277300 [Podospora fimiseda]|uniref:Uncharacterized protein n=1 Tax=Podospora fimiseda TaxID=252190 RepID=A0AAN7BXA3_9PEZI|nr:hypothetical protein QBC38DRAFT_277300 [Podospora fimiseda]
MSANDKALAGQGEFHDSIKPSKPMMTHGHQIGQKVGNDAFPEFHAKTYPPGSAPKESTFYPNPISEIPGQANNDMMDPSSRTSPLDMPGATSKSVYNEAPIGRPVEGQGDIDRRRAERGGLDGVSRNPGKMDFSADSREKGLRANLSEGTDFRSKGISATERIPVSASEVASDKHERH